MYFVKKHWQTLTSSLFLVNWTSWFTWLCYWLSAVFHFVVNVVIISIYVQYTCWMAVVWDGVTTCWWRRRRGSMNTTRNVEMSLVLCWRNPADKTHSAGCSVKLNLSFDLTYIPGATFSKLLRKILGRFLILGLSLTISWKNTNHP